MDGERCIEKIEELDTEGAELTMKSRLIGVHKRGSGASVETESLIVDSKGKTLYKITSGAFLVGAKDFKDSGNSVVFIGRVNSDFNRLPQVQQTRKKLISQTGLLTPY